MSDKKRNCNLYPKLAVLPIVTSTPIRQNVHPNISHNLSTSNNNTPEHSIISDNTWTSIGTHIISSDSNDSEDEEVDISVRKRIANAGKDWIYFKPKDFLSIYGMVLREADFTKDIASQWIKLWQNHHNNGIAFMLQFFIDVAGYQDYNIAKVYNTTQFNEVFLHKEFETNCPAALVDYTYLLRTKSEWSNKFIRTIFNFLREIIICVSEIEGNNYEILVDLLNFMKIMSRSKLRPIKHTGVVIAVNFLVSLSKLHGKCKEQLKQCASTTNVLLINADDVKDIQMKKDKLTKLINYLLSIVFNNVFIQDPQLKDMRIACLNCLWKALHYSPDVFFQANVLDIFLKFLLDSNSEVRLASLQIFKTMVKSKTCYPYFVIKTLYVFPYIFACRLEADLTIAIAAIDVFTEALKLYRNEIPKTVLNKMFLMIYNKNYRLGSAAGRFLYAYISDIEGDKVGILKSIIRFSKMPNVHHLLPLLVESLMDCALELHSYKTILKLILADEELQFADRRQLLQIFCHTVIQTVTGRAVLVRTNCREGKIDNHQIGRVTRLVLPQMNDLLTEFLEETDCVKTLLEMLLSFSYQDALTVQYRIEIIQILELLSQHFLHTNEPDILNLISKYFSKIDNEYCPLNTCSSCMLENIFKDLEEEYDAFLKDKSKWERDPTPFENVLLKLRYLYQHHDISKTWEIENIPNLCVNVTKSNEKLLSYNLLCGLSYEMKKLKNLLLQYLSDDDKETNLKRLRHRCDEFLDVSFNNLAYDNSPLLMKTAFECICDYSIAIADEIFKDKYDKAVKSLRRDTISSDNLSLLNKFLDRFIFNVLVSDSTGLKYFGKLCTTIMKRGLPFSLLPNVLTYYNSFYQTYGEIFNEVLKNISKLDANVLGIAVSATLFLEFQKLKNKSINNVAKEAVYIKKLALQFAKVLSAQFLVSTLRFGIHYAFAEKENLYFLHYLEHLYNNLPPNSKSFLMEYTLGIEGYEKFREDKYVIELITFLRDNKRKHPTPAHVHRRKVPSSDSTNESIDFSGTSHEISEISEEEG